MAKSHKMRGKIRVGDQFGELTVIERAEDHVRPCGVKVPQWKCRCSCGNEIITQSLYLYDGKKDCGHGTPERLSARRRTHGKTQTRIYSAFRAMHKRCENPNCKAYKDYGARGISVCEEWEHFEPFYEWAVSVGYDEAAPRGEYTLDRINNDLGYSPANCRFVTYKTQENNKRNNRIIEYQGETKTLSQWSEFTGVPRGLLYDRIYRQGWSVERAFTEPKQKRNLRKGDNT